VDRRVVFGGGAALALAAGLGVAVVFMNRDHAPNAPPPASRGGLVVETGHDDNLRLDPRRPLRCFVGGQFVGQLPLAVCAQRNGVATGALDVGIDRSGALAASNGVSADIAPLPPSQAQPSQPPVIEAPTIASGALAQGSAASGLAQATAADCWRYGAGWRELPGGLSLGACVQALYAGQCQGRNQALYGRWGTDTLRLTDGRVEISPDNRDFHSLIDPWSGCPDAEG